MVSEVCGAPTGHGLGIYCLLGWAEFYQLSVYLSIYIYYIYICRIEIGEGGGTPL